MRMIYAKTNEVVHKSLRVGVGADRHTASAVSADFGPVGVTALRINLPT